MFDKVKDSGERREFGTGSVRDVRTGKGRFDLIPAYALRRLAVHYENGAVKYGEWNWMLGQPLSGYLDSAERHLQALKEGLTDEDHAAAVAWNAFSYMTTKYLINRNYLPKELDDVVLNVEDARRMQEKYLEAKRAKAVEHNSLADSPA